jgi:[protein-PII] uridylyltransferase
VRGLAGAVDETLLGLWQRSGMPAGPSLVAVGGYGRGELFPHSDVDVLVLLPARRHRRLEACAGDRALHHRLLGRRARDRLERAHRRECVADGVSDVTVQTALLERASSAAERRSSPRSSEATDGRRWTPRRSCARRRSRCGSATRSTRTRPTPLEPNCKESPGGLRDLQTVIWVARAAGLGRTWQQLAAHGLITPFEVRQLQRNEGVLKLIRARLH